MCGIAGIYSPRMALDIARMSQAVGAMTGSMTHRGPDADGIWLDEHGRCVLGHRRLSIIDTSDAGIQPMLGAGGRHVITFNGEIYNFLEIRPALEKIGVQFSGRTDTEVLLEAIAAWGVKGLSRLDGMFAFAQFDKASGELLLVRDPFGEKPLYYTELDSGAIAFASELQALERCPGFDARVNVAAMAELLSFQYIGAPRSIYSNVKKLPAGHWMRIDTSGRIEIGRYFAYTPGVHGFSSRKMEDLADELEDILVRSISRRMISDVPLGAFLSGGVDSSTVCALVRRRLKRPLKTFSMGFPGAPESEHLIARRFADELGTEHFEDVLVPDAASFLHEIGGVLDEPNGDSSCLPTFLLAKFARRHVTVALSGDGGDEMFGGYGRYFATLEEAGRHRRGEIGDWWSAGGVYYGPRILVAAEAQIEEMFGFVPEPYREHLAALRAQCDGRTDAILCEMRRQDAENYMPGAVLPKVDRMSMQSSLEVRTPFLNIELARFAERLPDEMLVEGNRGKLVLRELAYRYLPRDLVDLPKKGFGLPMSDWARDSMLGVATELLSAEDGRLAAVFGPSGISRFLERQRTPGQFSAYQVWTAATLESWLRHHVVELPSPEEARSGRERVRVTAAAVPPAAAPIASQGAAPLHVHAIAPDVFVATQRRAADAEALLGTMPSELMIMALEHLGGRFGESVRQVAELPPYGQSLTDEAAGRSPLAGGTLLYSDENAAQQFGHAECETLRRLGVRRALMMSAHDRSTVVDMSFARRGPLAEAFAKLWLFHHRAALLSNRRWLRFFGAKRFQSSDNLQVSDEIRAIDPFPDVELSDRFALFEGGRQLPPVVSYHADIRARGNGRYSLWNQQVFFAPTQGQIADSKTYWLVKVGERTQGVLPIVRRDRSFASRSKIDFGVIDRLVARPVDRGERLRPGDPVVVCTHALPPGGAERQWVYLAQALTNLGYKVTFLCYEPLEGRDGHYLPILQKMNIDVVECDKLSVLEAMRDWPADAPLPLTELGKLPAARQLLALTTALRRLGPKAVFLQLDHPNVVGALAAHAADVPLVVMSFRNYNPSHFPYLMNDWLQPSYVALARSQRLFFTGNNRGANDDYADWIGIPRDRVDCIPNVIDPGQFPLPSAAEVAALRAELRLGADTPVVLGVFRLSDEKDPFTFVDVCAKAFAQVPDARGFIAGVGPLQERLEARIEKLGLGGKLTLLGRRNDVNVLVSIASMLLLTSLKEGMPNVVLEAQLLAKPVVATRVGSVEDIVIPEETALVFEPGDVPGLSSGVVALLRDRERARSMGTLARRRILDEFQPLKLGERYACLVSGVEGQAPRTDAAMIKASDLVS